MYFPFLRGKQYELIALREIGDLIAPKSLINPVIEPVKESQITLSKTISILAEFELPFTIIVNPTVGELVNNHQVIVDTIRDTANGYPAPSIGVVISNERSLNTAIQVLEGIDFENAGVTIIHNSIMRDIQPFIDFSERFPVKYNIINFNRTNRRYYRNFDKATLITLEESNFELRKRNVDYRIVPDEPFTEEHKYFQDDGFVGFSDYVTIGEPYSESGFLPYAVAIHLTYLDDENNFRIRHFVSDSNDDQSDVAGKFREALDHLISWVDENPIETRAINIFRELHERGHFPGLGTVKKLSIMNHIELVDNVL